MQPPSASILFSYRVQEASARAKLVEGRGGDIYIFSIYSYLRQGFQTSYMLIHFIDSDLT